MADRDNTRVVGGPDRDRSMLYDDSDQDEFHECIATLVKATRWDLERYLYLKGFLDLIADMDDPVAMKAWELDLERMRSSKHSA